MDIRIIFYKKENGCEPAKDFLDSLDVKKRAKMMRTVMLLAQNGNCLREPHSKHLDDGIFELRAKVGTDISRVLYFFYIGHKAVLTNGFIKKTDKTPVAEIEKAKRYRADFIKRSESHD